MTMPSEPYLTHTDSAVIVALGSNLSGDYASSMALLEAALAAFPSIGLRILKRSGWWRSAAWPNPDDPPFVNAVAIVDTDLSAAQVLAALHGLEARFGRDRAARNAPRTLDLDLVAFGRDRAEAPRLPHPRAHDRAFVMRPLAQIAPRWRHPVLGSTAEALAATARVGADACEIDAPA